MKLKALIVGLVSFLLMVMAPQVGAVDEYGCGTYGAETYGESCPDIVVTPTPVSNPTPTPTPTSTPVPTVRSGAVQGSATKTATTPASTPSSDDSASVASAEESVTIDEQDTTTDGNQTIINDGSRDVRVITMPSGDLVAVSKELSDQSSIPTIVATVGSVAAAGGAWWSIAAFRRRR